MSEFIRTAVLADIAAILHTSVGTLQARPLDMQEHLCKAYLDLRQCDEPTLRQELDRIITLSRTFDETGKRG